MSARIISVANIKGGVSKTSTALFLATALSKNRGKKVLFLDCDSQASAFHYRNFEKTRIYEGEEEPYRIRKTDPTFIFDTIEDTRDSYDVIFIDLPRLTRTDDDTKISMILAICDSVLIPVGSGELDHLSTSDFVSIVKKIESRKKGKGYDYTFAVFASMTGRTPTADDSTRDYMASLNIPVIKSEMGKLARFEKPYTYESLLDIGKPEKSRFEPFFNEVIEFFNL